VDAEIRLLKDGSIPLTHHTEINFYLGAKETVGMVRLLDCEVLRPGANGFVQLELREPVIAAPGDRFILRRPSPPETIGGGVIINAPADRRYKRFDPVALKSLVIKQAGDPTERYLQHIQSHFPISIAEFRKSTDLPFEMGILVRLASEGRIILLEGGKGEENRFLVEKDWFQTLTDKMIRLVENYHKKYTLKPGMPREELNSKMGLDPRVFGAFLVGWSSNGIIVDNGTTLRLSNFSVEFSRQQQVMITSLMEELARNPYTPPSVKDLMVRMGEPLYLALINGKVLRQVSREVFFEDKLIQPMTEKVTRYIQEHDSISLAQCRDLFNTSRKYAQAFLEYLDEINVTVREGDIRHLKV
jgi:selenocysteine-specific elongation factor